MENLHSLTIDELVDVLSTQTTLYVKMHVEGATRTEFEKCWLMMKAVQAEIKARQEYKVKQPQ
jgi:hypothetical protein